MKHRFVFLLLGLALVCALTPVEAGARPDKGKDIFGHLSTGWLLPEGDFGRIADDGWYLNGGVLYWPEDWAIGLKFDLGYTNTDIKQSVINAINTELMGMGAGSITGGDVTIWSGSANAVWGPDTDSAVGFYLTAGVGLDYVEGRITDNALVYYPPICDPWLWWCIPGGVGPGTIVVLSEHTTDFSWNWGVGVTFELSSGSQIFIEARYETVETSPQATEYIPIVVGYRW